MSDYDMPTAEDALATLRGAAYEGKLRAAVRVVEDTVRGQAEEIEHHVEELEIRMADITRLSAEREELRAWVADMERRNEQLRDFVSYVAEQGYSSRIRLLAVATLDGIAGSER